MGMNMQEHNGHEYQEAEIIEDHVKKLPISEPTIDIRGLVLA